MSKAQLIKSIPSSKTIRILSEDHERLKKESEYFDLPIGELVHIHLAWYKRQLKRAERTPGEAAVSG